MMTCRRVLSCVAVATLMLEVCLVGGPQVARPPFVKATTDQAIDAAKLGMVAVPAGPFIIGAFPGREGSDVWPAQVVSLKPFYIDKTEVTNAAFRDFLLAKPEWLRANVLARNSGAADDRYLDEFKGTEFPTGRGQYPVVWVSWNAAEAFCAWRSKRLPTAAEWEKAARGTDGRTYPWGEEFNGTKANTCDRKCQLPYRDASFDDGHVTAAPVGSFAAGASPYGALDMAGNVLEWVQDWRDRSNAYYKALPVADPQGPTSRESRDLKGGSFFNSKRYLGVRADHYFAYPPRSTLEYVGFRCAMNARVR